MKTHAQLVLWRLADPRTMRMLLFGLALLLTLLAQTPFVNAAPDGGNAGCGG